MQPLDLMSASAAAASTAQAGSAARLAVVDSARQMLILVMGPPDSRGWSVSIERTQHCSGGHSPGQGCQRRGAFEARQATHRPMVKMVRIRRYCAVSFANRGLRRDA